MSVAVALTGTLNVLVELALPVVALGLLSLAHEHYPLLTTVATIGLVVFILVAAALGLGLARLQYARRAGDAAAGLANRALRILKRGPVTWSGDTVVRFRNDAIGVMGRRGLLLMGASIAGQLSVFGVLFASLRAVGVPASEVSLVEVFAAWSLVRLISAFPITPGDLGIIEVGLTGALVAFGGANAPVVAAVLVYRVLSTVPTLILGAIAGLSWHRLDAPPVGPHARRSGREPRVPQHPPEIHELLDVHVLPVRRHEHLGLGAERHEQLAVRLLHDGADGVEQGSHVPPFHVAVVREDVLERISVSVAQIHISVSPRRRRASARAVASMMS